MIVCVCVGEGAALTHLKYYPPHTAKTPKDRANTLTLLAVGQYLQERAVALHTRAADKACWLRCAPFLFPELVRVLFVCCLDVVCACVHGQTSGDDDAALYTARSPHTKNTPAQHLHTHPKPQTTTNSATCRRRCPASTSSCSCPRAARAWTRCCACSREIPARSQYCRKSLCRTSSVMGACSAIAKCRACSKTFTRSRHFAEHHPQWCNK